MAALGWSRSLRRIVIAGAVCVTWSASAHASTVLFATTIDQAQETPPSGSAATGSGTFTMDTDANTFIGTVTFSGLGSAEIAAHIHGYAPPGTPAPIVFGLPAGSPKAVNWNFTEVDQPQIIAELAYVNIHSMNFPGGEVRGQILRVPSCGDGILDGGEQCDDGGNDAGDCCDPSCQFEAATSPCGDGLCNAGECDGAGACDPIGIRTGCRTALKSGLLIKDSSDDAKDKLIWKWIKGAATTLEELGLPTGTTSYALCIYAGTAAISADVAPSALLWKPTGTTGFKYKDKTGSSDGVQKVLLKSGAAGKAKALFKGKGVNLPDLPSGTLPVSIFPVTTQLVNNFNNVCYEAVFNSGNVKKNQADQFKAKSP